MPIIVSIHQSFDACSLFFCIIKFIPSFTTHFACDCGLCAPFAVTMVAGGLCTRNLPVELEVGEAAGVLLVVLRNCEDGFVKLVVTELLKSHSGCDGGKYRNIYRGGKVVQ